METKHPSSSLRFPPELVLQIFHDLDRLPPTSPTDKPYVGRPNISILLNLMSVSMVCREWFTIARPMISAPYMRNPFGYLKTVCYSNEIQRLAALLSTARQLGLPYCEEMKHFEITVIHFLDEMTPRGERATAPEDHNALFTILTLTTGIHLTLKVPAVLRRHSRRLSRFYPHLKPYCSGVQSLRICFPTEWDSSFPTSTPRPSNDPHIADLIRSVQPSLSALQVISEPDAATLVALRDCAAVRTVAFEGCGAWAACEILRGLREVRKITLRHLHGPGTVKLLEEMRIACRGMRVLEIETPLIPWGEDISEHTVALAELVAICDRLERLRISHVPYMVDEVLRAMVRSCPNLETLELVSAVASRRLGGLTGAAVWEEGERLWPKLRRLEILGVLVVPEFVEHVVKQCERLEEAVLWRGASEDEKIKAMLESRGFKLEGVVSVGILLAWRWRGLKQEMAEK